MAREGFSEVGYQMGIAVRIVPTSVLWVGLFWGRVVPLPSGA